MAELWPGGVEYEGGGAFPVTTDSILLADFVRVRPYSAVLELCCGAGLISLLLHHRARHRRPVRHRKHLLLQRQLDQIADALIVFYY